MMFDGVYFLKKQGATLSQRPLPAFLVHLLILAFFKQFYYQISCPAVNQSPSVNQAFVRYQLLC